MGKWEIEEEEEQGDVSWANKGKEKSGEWTFSKKESSWGTDKDLASAQEVTDEDPGLRQKKAANQANILNILSKLILEANEDEEDEEREERRSRWQHLLIKFNFVSCSEGVGRVEPVAREDAGVRVKVVRSRGRRMERALTWALELMAWMMASMMREMGGSRAAAAQEEGKEGGSRPAASQGDKEGGRGGSWVATWATARPLGTTPGSVMIARMSLRQSARSFRRQSFGQKLTNSVELR